jgi:hypothetical protein
MSESCVFDIISYYELYPHVLDDEDISYLFLVKCIIWLAYNYEPFTGNEDWERGLESTFILNPIYPNTVHNSL